MEFLKDHQLNILLALSSICAITIVFVLITNYISKKKKYSLLILMTSASVLLFADRLAYIYRGDLSTLGYFMVRISNYLVFATSLSIVYGYNEFFMSYELDNMKRKSVSKSLYFVRYFIIVGEIFLLLSQVFNLYYYFDANNCYQRGDFFLLSYIFPVTSLVIELFILIKNRKDVRKHLFMPLLLFMILPLIATFFQVFTYGLSLTNITSVGSVLLLYVSVINDANKRIKENERIESELNIASEIQVNECPNEFPAFPSRSDFDLYASMDTAREVGGDFYDYFFLDDDHLALVIADVSDKGVPAALNMVKAKVLVKGIGLYVNDPARVLELLNDGFLDNNKLDMFVTVWLGIIDFKKKRLVFSNAGHEDFVLYNKAKGFISYKTKHGVPIGTVKDYKYSNFEVDFNKGDKLFLYTDGLIDSINRKKKVYGIDNLLKILNKNYKKSPKDIISCVKKDIKEFIGDCEQFDDTTMLCFSYDDIDKNRIKVSKKFDANLKSLDSVYNFIFDIVSSMFGESKVKKYYVVVDEIFSNIVNYGFKNKNKDNFIKIDLDIDKEEHLITATFIDNGIPFNPLEKQNPNLDLSIEDKKEGGLGIYIVKSMMDEVNYEYKNKENHLTLKKHYKE